jgi:hypothetical protein
MVSSQRQAFAEIASGVLPEDLSGDDLSYSRGRDKADHSLELFKFYVNALYVAITRVVENLYLLESDTAHPLLQLLTLQTSEAATLAQAQTSSLQEWAQEARRLELQGKQEQADAIRQNVLKTQKPGWPVWDEAALQELLPKALQPGQISNKPRQALLDYALWHGQTWWIHQLAQSNRFEPAQQLSLAIQVIAGHRNEPMHSHERYDGYIERVKQQRANATTLLIKKIQLVTERQRQPYAGRAFKEVLRQCDQYGVDHRSYFNTTPLMMAAQCGNLPLVEELLARGADPLLRDHYGHSAWDHALVRTLDDPLHLLAHLDALFPLLSPPSLDVQAGGRLVRLERHQGEYWLLSVMLASYKTMFSEAVPDAQVSRNTQGFCADYLMRGMERLPDSILSPQRKKRTFFNAVLARAEQSSSYQPSRQLWTRIKNGYYMFNQDLKLRANSSADWVSWQQWVNQPLVCAGCGIQASMQVNEYF